MSTLKKDECVDLPPGFRFHPTDEEIITHYLFERIKDSSFTATAMGEADLNKCEPWDLPGKATMGEKEWYFFCQRDRKYPTGMRTNRATESGYWKATGKDKEIYKGKGYLVGMKKTLVFYMGRAPKGEKTNWVMHEYRLESKSYFWKLPKSAKDEWVVCRVLHKKSTGITTRVNPEFDFSVNTSMYSNDDHSETSISLQRLMESGFHRSSSFTTGHGGGDFVNGPMSSFQFHTGATASSSMDPYQLQNLPGEGFNNSNYYDYDCDYDYNMIPTPTTANIAPPPPYPTTAAVSPIIRRHCKVEQYSSNSHHQSPEMGTGNRTTDYDDVATDAQVPSSSTAMVDFDSLLN